MAMVPGPAFHTTAADDSLLRASRGEEVLPCATASVLARQHLGDSGFDAPNLSACCTRRPNPPKPPATGGRSKSGSDLLPTVATNTRASCAFLTSRPRLARCCYPRLGISLPVFNVSPRGTKLRRLRLPVPFGDQLSACATCGVLPSRHPACRHECSCSGIAADARCIEIVA